MEKKRKATKKKVVTNTLENKAEKPVTKTKAPKKEAVKLDKSKIYEFISNGTAERLPKGSIWSVTGETAEIYLSAGYGDLKK